MVLGASVRLLCLGLAEGLACAAFGASVSLIPIADTSIMEVAPNNNVGGRSWVNAGSNMHTQRNRGLFKFDIAGSLPAGSQVTSASLSLAVTGIPADGYAVSFFDLHRLLRNWGEGTNNPFSSPGQGSPATTNEATWLSPLSLTTNVWTAPGAAATNDYDPTVTASQIIYSTVQSPYLFPDPSADATAIIADVQRWLDNPATNFGWILICESDDVPSTARRFGSREDPNNSPMLQLEYLAPPLVSAVETAGTQFRLYFTAQAGQSYVVQYRITLAPSNTWSTLTNISAPLATTNLVITDVISGRQRFYRIGTQ
jgi:hypothetical protein